MISTSFKRRARGRCHCLRQRPIGNDWSNFIVLIWPPEMSRQPPIGCELVVQCAKSYGAYFRRGWLVVNSRFQTKILVLKWRWGKSHGILVAPAAALVAVLFGLLENLKRFQARHIKIQVLFFSWKGIADFIFLSPWVVFFPFFFLRGVVSIIFVFYGFLCLRT